MALMFEQLGAASRNLGLTILAGPLAALPGDRPPARRVRAKREFFACGRRVRLLQRAGARHQRAVGGAGLPAFDRVVLHHRLRRPVPEPSAHAPGSSSWRVLLAPFLRKFGAYTVPSYSRPPLREPTPCGSSRPPSPSPLLLLLAAEARFAAYAAAWLLDSPSA